MNQEKAQQVEERDINDLFDEIALTEERLSQQGYAEGCAEGRVAGGKEGYQLGYSQGIQLGEELANIYGSVVAQQQLPHTDRTRRTLLQLREAIDTFPRHNDPEENIVGAVEHIRNLDKRLQSMLGQKHRSTLPNTVATERKDYSF